MDPSFRPLPTRRARRVISAIVGIAATGGLVVAASSAGAAGDHKVTLCHATDSTTNPYSLITVDYHSITLKGHGGHEGPLYAPGMEHGWGDVIPAFDFGGHQFAGANLDEAGQALLASGCMVVPPPSTTTTTITDT
jgi:hypothetical protein